MKCTTIYVRGGMRGAGFRWWLALAELQQRQH